MLISSTLNACIRCVRAFSLAALCLTASPFAHAVAVSGQGTWEITLQGRDLDGNASTFEAYYDTVLDMTWLADANYLGGHGVNPYPWSGWDGGVDFVYAQNWVNDLNVYGIDDWRLPQNLPGSLNEISHLYHAILGNDAYCPPGQSTCIPAPEFGTTISGGSGGVGDSAQGAPINTGPFSNVMWAPYWYGMSSASGQDLSFAPHIGGGLVDFGVPGSGLPVGVPVTGDGTPSFVWVVRSGDVAAVPEPQSWLLMLMGLGALTLLATRRVGLPCVGAFRVKNKLRPGSCNFRPH